MALMRIYGELGRIARLPNRPGFFINSDPSMVVLCFQPSSILWQGLVIIAWGLSGDRGSTLGVNGLPLVGLVFFSNSSLVGVVLFPSFAQ